MGLGVWVYVLALENVVTRRYVFVPLRRTNWKTHSQHRRGGDGIARARKCFENAEIKRVKRPDGRIED